jgi:transcriptional regulator with XRE-family HTH domain
MAFGKLVRDSRTSTGMTLAELSAEIDLSIAYLSRIERDRENPPRDELIRRIACALKLSEDVAFAAARRLPPDLQDKCGEVIAAYRRFSDR